MVNLSLRRVSDEVNRSHCNAVTHTPFIEKWGIGKIKITLSELWVIVVKGVA